jgi:uridine kinase
MQTKQTIEALVSRVKSSTKKCGITKVITIDGPAGSGKTTLANQLAEVLSDCAVIHMDDLYNGWTQDLHGELATRINQKILIPLSQNKSAQFEKYDWATNSFSEKVSIAPPSYLILEGVGSGHPDLNLKSALNVWIEADPSLLLERLVKRDGEALRDDLVRWQTHEAQYFSQLSIKQLADVCLTGD